MREAEHEIPPIVIYVTSRWYIMDKYQTYLSDVMVIMSIASRQYA